MTLAELPLNQLATVVWVHTPGADGERLMEMGFTPGAEVRVLRGGCPLQLRIRGYRLGLRRTQAEAIEVQA